MANALFRSIPGTDRTAGSVDVGNIEALNDRYLDFGLQPPEHVADEVPEIEDLEEEPVRYWVIEGKKPPLLKVRWYLHEEAPRENPSWFAQNVTATLVTAFAIHAAIIYVVATSSWTPFDIDLSAQQGRPVEIVFAPDLFQAAPGPAPAPDIALSTPLLTEVEPLVTEEVEEEAPEDPLADLIEAETEPDLALEEPDLLPPEIDDLAADGLAEEDVDALSTIAALPEPELPDVEPIPEPEPEPPPPPPEPTIGTGPEAPDPVDVAEPTFDPPAAEEPFQFEEEFVAEGLLEEIVPDALNTPVEAPELFEPDDLFALPPADEIEVDVAIDGNDVPVDTLLDEDVAALPLPDPIEAEPVEPAPVEPEPVEPEIAEPELAPVEDQVAALIEEFAPEVDVADDPTFPEPETQPEPDLAPEIAPAGELDQIEPVEPELVETEVAEILLPEPDPLETPDLVETVDPVILEEAVPEETVAEVPEPEPAPAPADLLP
ncbi:MAG: hypothetical protein AAGF58_09545, partial [Pseudomonadota bacterium]